MTDADEYPVGLLAGWEDDDGLWTMEASQMIDFNDLISRLEASTGPDRELDALVWCAAKSEWEIPAQLGEPTWVSHPMLGGPRPAERLTFSVDACLALMREVLPDWRPQQIVWASDEDSEVKWVSLGNFGECDDYRYGDSQHTSLPHAILIALLRALQRERAA